MLQHLRTERGIWLALVAACILVLQFAAGANAAFSQLPLDAFGNPLCVSGSDHGAKETAPPSHHSGKPECCTLACGASATAALTGKLIYAVDRPFPVLGEQVNAECDVARRQLLDEFQGSPRAPPY
ncbi:hypothetical protein J2Y48_004467 [Mycoplana sp. BE70]|uniref:hypothetical protein n=1 Tax=Mycoplana sp. BE70 TaxID=2817775 RepID=UPI002855E9DA|nr:hypothetical protein [Mycoplana sp. BE70]MDR6759151.1 hypothetical protein [Mycoplana sp. BE70]